MEKGLMDKVSKRMCDELADVLRIACLADMLYFAESVEVFTYNKRKEVYLDDHYLFCLLYPSIGEVEIRRSDYWLKVIKKGRKRVEQ